MQKRIKTYGKRSTRIITVPTTTVSTSSANTFPQPTSTNDPDGNLSSSSTQSSDPQSSPPLLPKHIPNIDLKTRKYTRKPKPTPLATRDNMNVVSSRIKSKSMKSDAIQYTKPIPESRKGESRTRGPPIKPQPSTATGAGTRSKKTSPPPRINTYKRSSKQSTQSETSDSESPIQSRAGPRSRPKKYVVTESSESSSSEIEVPNRSNSESPSSQSSQVSLRRDKVTSTKRGISNDDTGESESSIDSLPQARFAKPSSRPLSSSDDGAKPTCEIRLLRQ
jgi:hypothetical protein